MWGEAGLNMLWDGARGVGLVPYWGLGGMGEHSMVVVGEG